MRIACSGESRAGSRTLLIPGPGVQQQRRDGMARRRHLLRAIPIALVCSGASKMISECCLQPGMPWLNVALSANRRLSHDFAGWLRLGWRCWHGLEKRHPFYSPAWAVDRGDLALDTSTRTQTQVVLPDRFLRTSATVAQISPATAAIPTTSENSTSIIEATTRRALGVLSIGGLCLL